MATDAIAAWVAAAVALAAAGIATWQARSASSQAASAREAAEAAQRQALAADRQAIAAEEQLNLLKADSTEKTVGRRVQKRAEQRSAVTEVVRAGWTWKGAANELIEVRATVYCLANPASYRPATDTFRAALINARAINERGDVDQTLGKLLHTLDNAPDYFERLRGEHTSDSTPVAPVSRVRDARRIPRDVDLLLRDLEWHVTNGRDAAVDQ